MAAAPPLDLSQLASCLLQGNSLDPVLRKAATDTLSASQTHPDFYVYLIQIVSNQAGLDLGEHAPVVKLQAAVQFKNGIDKYWRRGAPNAIRLAQKRAIKPKLLELMDEPDRVLAKTIALCVGKIARLDYGTDWDDLPTSLLNSLQIGLSHPEPLMARLILHRTFLILHETIKSLSSNRTFRGRSIMAAIGPQVFPMLRELHIQMLRNVSQGLGNGSVGTLVKMFIYGFADVTKDASASEFFISLLPTLINLHALRLSFLSTPTNPKRIENATRHVGQFGKLYRAMLQSPTLSKAYAQFNVSDQVIEFYWGILQNAAVDVKSLVADESSAAYPERFIVQSLLVISNSLGDWSSAPHNPPPPGFSAQFVHLVITQFLPLRPDDLEKWAADPEEWMNEEEADRWEFDLRPCAEYVVQQALHRDREELAPSMASLLEQASSTVPQNMDELLLKEGIYCAFGKCASSLNDAVDFGAWLERTLVPEAADTRPDFRIIRRRIAWLVGKWLAEDLIPETRARVCSLLVHLVSQNDSTDTAIRLTAARSLGNLCAEWEFEDAAFLPYLEVVIRQLADLLGTVELQESKMRLNTTLGNIIDRVPEHISPYAPQLVEMLIILWGASEENHFKVSILVTLTKLAEAVGEQSQAFHSQLCRIIQYSSDVTQVFLQEDALQLWLVLLRRASSISPDMFNLLPTLISLLQSGTDVLPRVLVILESYLLLDAAQVLQLYLHDLFASFEDLLGDLRVDAVKVVLHALETVFQTAPIEVWASALDSSGTFVRLLHPLRARIDNMSEGEQQKLTALALGYLLPCTNPTILSRLGEFFSLWSSVLASRVEPENEHEPETIPDYYYDAGYDNAETLETARRKTLMMQDPVFRLRTATVVRQKLGEAEALNGGSDTFRVTYLSTTDPEVISEFLSELGRQTRA